MTKTFLLVGGFCILSLCALVAQASPPSLSDDLDLQMDRALDFFSSGEYDEALLILREVLATDPTNERTLELMESIRALYKIDRESDEQDAEEESTAMERPDFTLSGGGNSEEDKPIGEEPKRPDFSVRDADEEAKQPKDSRSIFELSLSPSFVPPWNISERSVIFPTTSSYSASLNGSVDYYLNLWGRILGLRGGYSLFLLNREGRGFAGDQLHVIDAMLNFRTFFSESYDARIIFKIAFGYRGYFAGGYTFYTTDKALLNGFNMGFNLEAPLLYLFWKQDILKRIVFDVDTNLLFFPELSTLNILDFKVKGEYLFSNFSLGVHFGGYSILASSSVEYLWLTGLSFKLFF